MTNGRYAPLRAAAFCQEASHAVSNSSPSPSFLRCHWKAAPSTKPLSVTRAPGEDDCLIDTLDNYDGGAGHAKPLWLATSARSRPCYPRPARPSYFPNRSLFTSCRKIEQTNKSGVRPNQKKPRAASRPSYKIKTFKVGDYESVAPTHEEHGISARATTATGSSSSSSPSEDHTPKASDHDSVAPIREEHGISARENRAVGSLNESMLPTTKITNLRDGIRVLEIIPALAPPDDVGTECFGARPSCITVPARFATPRNLKLALRRQKHAADKSAHVKSLRPAEPSWIEILKILERDTPRPEYQHLGPARDYKLYGKKQMWLNKVGQRNIIQGFDPASSHDSMDLTMSPTLGTSYVSGITREGTGSSIAAPQAQGTTNLRHGDDHQVGSASAEEIDHIKVQKITRMHAAHEIRMPNSWTKFALRWYVRCLVRSRQLASTSLERPNTWVVHELLDFVLFEHNPSRAELTRRTLHEALSYFVRTEKLSRARRFLAQMEDAGFAPNEDTYNIMIQGAARSHHLLAMHVFLSLMKKRDIVPTGRTWNALLLAVTDVNAKQTIARSMQQQGFLFQRASPDEDISAMVKMSFVPFVDAGGKISQYFETMDNLVGPGWLDQRSAVVLIDALTIRCRMQDCLIVLEAVVARSPDGKLTSNRLVHKLLHQCAWQRKADFALWLVIHAKNNWNASSSDRITLRLLLNVALKCRQFNLARVTWKALAVAGELDYITRAKVMRSLHLRRTQWASGKSVPRFKWERSFGSVVCGVDPVGMSEKFVERVMEHERNLYQKAAPTVPVVSLLMEALLLDKKWSATGTRKTAATQWLIDNAIHFPHRTLDGEEPSAGLQGPTTETPSGSAAGLKSRRRRDYLAVHARKRSARLRLLLRVRRAPKGLSRLTSRLRAMLARLGLSRKRNKHRSPLPTIEPEQKWNWSRRQRYEKLQSVIRQKQRQRRSMGPFV